MKKLVFLFFILSSLSGFSQKKLRDSVKVTNKVFSVIYSEKLEQPLWLQYKSTNRPTNVNRGSMDFYTEKDVKTSDGEDYKNNIYDKGHFTPPQRFQIIWKI